MTCGGSLSFNSQNCSGGAVKANKIASRPVVVDQSKWCDTGCQRSMEYTAIVKFHGKGVADSFMSYAAISDSVRLAVDVGIVASGGGLRKYGATEAVEGELSGASRTSKGKGLSCGGESFTAETPVLLANGQSVPIAQVRVGDKVVAVDTNSGDRVIRTVTKTWVNFDTDLLDLVIKRPYGGSSIVHTTQRHLFWNVGTAAWVEAQRLQPGERLARPDGTAGIVIGHQYPAVTSGFMWDLTVETSHNFFVATPIGAFLVHNNSCSIGGEAGKFDMDELAQFAYGHSGSEFNAARPSLQEIRGALDTEGVRLDGQNAIQYDMRLKTGTVRVIVNEDLPIRSTSYYLRGK